MLQIIKRDGRKVDFEPEKIENAVLKAFKAVDGEITPYATDKAASIANYITEKVRSSEQQFTVENIQDMVCHGMMNLKNKAYADAYIAYRAERTRARGNTTDKTILDITKGQDDYWKNENSNKDSQIASTQRDQIAGAVSTDLMRRVLLPKDIVEAHDEGIIHFHDGDYFVQSIPNCCLVNLNDMLQNGTVINKTMIEKPHSFVTACNITTQIMAQVASGQYGGQTISLAHLAPFVEESRKRIRERVRQELVEARATVTNSVVDIITENQVKDEIRRGVQIMQYQINTLNTSNGQTPFVTINAYLNEAQSEQEKDDLVLIIAEVFRQRIQGVKNEKGIWITPAFPKILYFLEEDNCREGTKYWWLTELAAKCTAKRLVPDYVSEKIMLRDKINANGEGNAFPCMGE